MKSYNYTTLAAAGGMSYNTFKKELHAMLSEPSIKARFGEIKKNRVSQKQLEIIAENIVGFEHLLDVKH